MDSGYWFLFLLWVINIVFGISSLISNKVSNKFTTQIIMCMCIFWGGALLGIGTIFGF